MPCKKSPISILQAVPIMEPGFLQPIFFKVSFHRVLGVELRMHLRFQKTQKKHLKGSDILMIFLFLKQYW